MTKITIKPKNADGPEIPGELGEVDEWGYYLVLAPDTEAVEFPRDDWEEVPPPFVFPTIGAVIEHTAPNGSKSLHIRWSRGWRGVATGLSWSSDTFESWPGKFRVVFPGEGAEQ